MRKLYILFFLLSLCLGAFSQEITVRFTGQLNGTSYCRLDSVAVTNLTRNWTETIEYPDTIIVLGGIVGTNLNIAATQGLGQNIPNPFDCETRVELSVSQRENVRMQLLDVSGKQYADYRGSLDAGVHTFDISAAAPQSYILNAVVGNRSYSIRMVNMGSGCGSSIKYAGISGSITAKLTTTNDFQNGDNMRYVGYMTIYGDIVASTAVEQTQTASEDITLDFAHCINTFDTDIQSACDSYTWIDGVTYTESTTEPTFTLTNAAGCDSVVTLHLTINQSLAELVEITACDSYEWRNETYTESGDYQQVFAAANGCDSVVTLHLTINHSNTGIDTQTVCDSYTWIDGITYTESTDEPTFTLTNAEGCDSVVILHLTINHSNTGIDEQTACDSYEWIDGVTYTESTTEPTFTLTNAVGCDSVVTLHLTINHSNTGIDEQTACDSYTWIDGETYTESTNTPTFTLTNAVGCDSVVTLHLTMVCPPTVQTISATNITTTGATLSGNVNSDGGAIVTARGFMYGTSANNLSQTVESGSGTGSYTKALTGLSSNTTYYYKAYAINSIRTSYGEVMSFTTSCECGGSYKVTDYDGNQYNTVLIGEQCWMAENLKTTKFANGSSISYGIYSDAWDVQYPRISETVSYRYYPNNSSGNVSTYGYLYNWPAVMHGASSSSTNPSNVQGICPTGWHLPSEAEWTQLTSYLKTQSQHQCGGSTTNIGKSLASTSGWNSSTNTCAVGNTPANNNSTGFGAKPAGYFDPTGYVDNVSECVKYFKSYAVYWSASSGSGSYLSCFVIATSNTGANVVKSYYRKNFGASVRCVKD